MAIFALLAVAAASIAQEDAGQARGAIILTRQDFAEVVQDVDARIAAGALLPEADGLSGLARTNDAFDALSAQFLGAKLGPAFVALEALRQDLGGEFHPSTRTLRLDVRRGDEWVRSATFGTEEVSADTPVRFRLRSVQPWPEAARSSWPVRFIRGVGGPTWPELEEPARFDDEARLVPFEFEVEPSVLAFAGSWQPFVWLGDESAAIQSLRLAVEIGPSPSDRRADWLRRIDAAEGVDEGSRRALTSRAELPWEGPSPERSAEFLIDPGAHRQAMEKDIASLERGVDPFTLRAGDHWRTFVHGRRDLAARVDLPEGAPADALPLVIAFHGAGGDEGFFFELAGDGHIKELAAEHGCLVVTPFTPDFLWSARAFDSLLAGISSDYPIDPERVFVLGHSMGTGATARICAERPDRIAGACCVAGFRPLGPGTPPTLVVQGERDRIVPARAVERAVEASEGADVTYVELEDQGHTLLLPAALDLAFERWFATDQSPDGSDGRR